VASGRSARGTVRDAGLLFADLRVHHEDH